MWLLYAVRWYGKVLAAELRDCAERLRARRPGPGPAGASPAAPLPVSDSSSRSAGGGHDALAVASFDLRDLYRAVRLLEIASEDLQVRSGFAVSWLETAVMRTERPVLRGLSRMRMCACALGPQACLATPPQP